MENQAPSAAQAYNPGSPPGGQFQNSPPMQVNPGQQGLLQQEAQTNPQFALNPSNMQGAQPPGEQFNSPLTPPSAPQGGSGGQGLLETAVDNSPMLLGLLGPEGMMAKTVLGAVAGGALGLLTHQGGVNDLGAAAIGAFAAHKLGDLVPASWLLGLASKKMETVLSNGESALDATGNKQNILSDALEKAFGTTQNPNQALIPNAPAAEMQGLQDLVQKEIASQGRGPLGNLNLKQIQAFKAGAGAKGAYDKSITNSTQKLYQNISQAYEKVLQQHAPGIQEANREYAHAVGISQQQAEFKNGTEGLRRLAFEAYDFKNALGVGKDLVTGAQNQANAVPQLGNQPVGMPNILGN